MVPKHINSSHKFVRNQIEKKGLERKKEKTQLVHITFGEDVTVVRADKSI